MFVYGCWKTANDSSERQGRMNCRSSRISQAFRSRKDYATITNHQRAPWTGEQYRIEAETNAMVMKALTNDFCFAAEVGKRCEHVISASKAGTFLARLADHGLVDFKFDGTNRARPLYRLLPKVVQ